jgi:hypothetical protein
MGYEAAALGNLFTTFKFSKNITSINPITRERKNHIPGEQNSQPHDCKTLKKCRDFTSYILYNFQNS